MKTPIAKLRPYIGGKYVDLGSNEIFTTINPATGEVLAEVDEVDEAAGELQRQCPVQLGDGFLRIDVSHLGYAALGVSPEGAQRTAVERPSRQRLGARSGVGLGA